MRNVRVWMAGLLVGAVGWGAAAQPLADRVPDDALVYVGWRGAADPGPGYAGSRLKQFLDASQVPQLVREAVPQMLAKMAEKDPGAAVLRDVLGKLGPAFWNYPTALYVGPVDGIGVANPVPRAALFCQAGKDAPQLRKDINDYLNQIPQQQLIPVVATEENGVVAVLLGNVTPDLTGKGGATLIHKQVFTDAMAQVGKDPAFAAYVDFEGITAMVDQVAAVVPQAGPKWTMVRDTLGLRGLKRFAMTSGFDGRDWGTQSFIAAPAPRSGLLTMIDAPPLSDDTLRAVPQSATMVYASNLDLAKFLDAGRTLGAKLDPTLPRKIDGGMAMAAVMLGFNIEQDLLKPLGDQWVVYNAPTVTGAGPLGFVLVNHARDAKRLEGALVNLERLANQTINAQTKPNQPKANLVTATIGGVTVHYLNTPLVTPAWAIDGGNLYVALYPQTVASAAHAAVAGGDRKSILDNADFSALRQRLGGARASSVSFYDLPRSAPMGYPYTLAATRVLGFADMFGIPTPAAVMPPLEQVMPALAPAGGVAWADDAGLHARSVTPFPGADFMAGPEALLMNATTLGFVLPAVEKAKAQKRAATATPATRE